MSSPWLHETKAKEPTYCHCIDYTYAPKNFPMFPLAAVHNQTFKKSLTWTRKKF